MLPHHVLGPALHQFLVAQLVAPPSKPFLAEIFVPFPDGFDSDDEDVDERDLVKYFNKQLKDQFRGTLDLDLQGDREIVDEMNVTRVEADSDGITVEYNIEYSAYLGCRDQNYADNDDRHVEGVCRGQGWYFKRHVSPEPLARNEEL